MGALLTKKEAAQFLGVSYAIVSNLVHEGKLLLRKIGQGQHGKSWRITRESIEQYVKGHDEVPDVKPIRMRTFEEAFPHWSKRTKKGSKRANFS